MRKDEKINSMMCINKTSPKTLINIGSSKLKWKHSNKQITNKRYIIYPFASLSNKPVPLKNEYVFWIKTIKDANNTAKRKWFVFIMVFN